ncbi:MAG TPA: RNA 2'-phosphotransferase [Sulfurovum sp.]
MNSKISKYLSYVLRHRPDSIGLKLDNYGWADIDELIDKTDEFRLTKEIIKKVVEENEKQRFSLDDNKIRANQGHSIDVDLNLISIKPPEILYHGTTIRFLPSILKQGILSKNRQYVHLSIDKTSALKVGERHGEPKVLEVKALKMYEDGYCFYLSKNKVWLTKYIPSEYL